MQTKFILHGGFNKERGDVHENDEFFQEMLKDAPAEAKILLVYFAEKEERINDRIDQDKGQLGKNSGSKRLDFKVATDEAFIEECEWADIIYLHGGKTRKLMEALRKYENLGKTFSGKTIAGDSAGAKVLGKLFYTTNSKEVGEGLGILPFKIIAHYVDGTPNPLEQIEPDLETVLLREYETRVFHR
jgi:peptidase E